VQRRHPLRRHGRALARRPRSPSTPPGPHPAARRGLRSRAGCSRCAYAPPRRHTAGHPVIRSEARSARCHPSHCSLATRSIRHTMHCGSTACHERYNGSLSRPRGGGARALGDGRNRCFNPGAPCLLRPGFRSLPRLPLSVPRICRARLALRQTQRHGCGRGPQLARPPERCRSAPPATLRLAVASGVPGHRGRLRRGWSRWRPPR
jgi:hypothetical protein